MKPLPAFTVFFIFGAELLRLGSVADFRHRHIPPHSSSRQVAVLLCLHDNNAGTLFATGLAQSLPQLFPAINEPAFGPKALGVIGEVDAKIISFQAIAAGIAGAELIAEAAARAMGRALEWDKGQGAMDLEKDLFAHYTLVEKTTGSTGDTGKARE